MQLSILAVHLAASLRIAAGLLSPSDVRLAGGPVPYVGRVEVFYNGSWGTVCDDSFDNSEAKVVCRMLGYHTQNVQAYGSAAFGRGNGTIIIDDLQCRGNETTLSECPSRPWLTSNCLHGHDAGVDCNKATISPSEIRLANGSTPHAGRVEVFINGSWGTICDDSFDNNDAIVICRMLGYSSERVHGLTSAGFGAGAGPVTLSNLRCSGGETTLSQCSSYYLPWLGHARGCGHSRDAGVDCQLNISANDIRLVNGPTASSGRVELLYNGTWGTVCGAGFDASDADVVCRMLGYGTQYVKYFTSAEFGQGSGPIYGYFMQCQGNETTLSDCPSKAWTSRYCRHSGDVGVDCHSMPLSRSDIRLVNGTSPYSGRVEVSYNGTWGTVCDNSFDDDDARVICRMLDYGTQYVQTFKAPGYGHGVGPIIIDNLQCDGSENSLSDCTFSPWLTPGRYCDHSRDAGVTCRQPISSHGIRLVNGTSPSAGRVELLSNGTWGTICDNAFDHNDAVVICRMLGYATQRVQPFRSAAFGRGSGPVFYDYLQCYGSEATITDCMANPWMSHSVNCGHDRDAGVDCNFTISSTDIRLVNGTPSSGRVEVLYNGVWGTLCGYDFDTNNAMMICRMLGFSGKDVHAFNAAEFGQGTGPTYGRNIECLGNETTLSSCRSSTWNAQCRHAQDAGVDCRKPTLSRSDIRLVGSTSPSRGRVEVLYNGSWGMICDTGFDDNAAKVVCHMLGYGTDHVQALSAVVYGQGRGPITVSNLQCHGNEETLSECRSSPWMTPYNSDCGHTRDAGVDCQRILSSHDVRLINGPSNHSGRVEVFYNDRWGTICDNGFDIDDATVICRTIGYETKHVHQFASAVFGHGGGAVIIDNLQCDGSEATLSDCRSNPWLSNSSSCGSHDRDVGVDCQFILSAADIRLVGGPLPSAGRVEVYYNGSWGTICDTNFANSDAIVICRMLGYDTQQVQAFGTAGFGSGDGPIHVDSLQCIGSEWTLSDCRSSTWLTLGSDCSHSMDAAVDCRMNISSDNIRLIDGASPFSGRIEVFYNESWGTICRDGFDVNDARVICRSLGYDTNHVQTVWSPTSGHGQGHGHIIIDNLRCRGNETTIHDCNSDPWMTHRSGCNHSTDAGVDCEFTLLPSAIRLVDGPSASSGRVEVFFNGNWGTVCDDNFDHNDAIVICRMLGFGAQHIEVYGRAKFGMGNGSIVIDELQCLGNETTLSACPSNPWMSNDCSHSEDASVDCRKHDTTTPVTVPTTSARTSTTATSVPSHTTDYIPVHKCTGQWIPWPGRAATYSVSWVTTDRNDVITFTITAPITHGQWVGFGLSHNNEMSASDVYIAHRAGNRWVVEDRYASGYSTPAVDVHQDVTHVTSHEDNGVLTVTFRRRIQTGDRDDINVTGCLYLLFAYGAADSDSIYYHAQNKVVSPNHYCFNICDATTPVTVPSTSARTSTKATSIPTPTTNYIPVHKCTGQWNPWTGRAATYNVYWMTTAQNDAIMFTITAPITHGQWVGFGLSHNNEMSASDVYIARRAGDRWVVEDRYASGYSTPAVDVHQDVTHVTSHEDNGVLTVTFRRRLQTSDRDDMNVTGCLYLLFAYGTADNDSIHYHAQNKVVSPHQYCFTQCDATTPVTVPSTSARTSTKATSVPSHTTDYYAVHKCTGMWIPWYGSAAYYRVSWVTAARNDAITFTITAPITQGQWVGFGLSHNNEMRASDVYIARRAGDRWVVEDRYASGYSTPAVDVHQDVTHVTSHEDNGGLTVTFRRRLETGDIDDMNVTGCLYLLFAYGAADNDFIHYHAQNKVVSPYQYCFNICASTTTDTAKPTPSQPSNIPFTECPGHWTPWHRNTAYRVSWVTTSRNDVITFTVTARITHSQWLGLGLSRDKQMSASDVYIAHRAGDKWVVEDRYASGYSTPAVDVHQDVTHVTSHEDNGVLTVTFRRLLETGDRDDMNVTGCLYLLFAYGAADNDSIHYHAQNKVVSPNQFCFKKCDELHVEDTIYSGCTARDWTVTLHMRRLWQIYPGAKADDIYMGESSCTGVVHGGILTFNRWFVGCLTDKRVTGPSIVYTNELVYAVHDTVRPYIIRRYRWTVPVQCDVYNNGTTYGHIPTDNSSSKHLYTTTNYSDYSVHLSFYQDPNYVQSIPGNPLHVGVGTFVYVKVYTPIVDWGVTMRVHTCYTKPTATSAKITKYNLIKNGCEVDTNTHISSQTAHETRFQFQNFESTAVGAGMFVFCDATFCGSADTSRHCTETCNPGAK